MELRMRSSAATVWRDVQQEPSTAFMTTRKQEVNSTGESEDEGGSIRKSKRTKHASSASVTEVVFRKYDTRKQGKELYRSGKSDGKDGTDLSTERRKTLPSQTEIDEIWTELRSTAEKGELEQKFYSSFDDICTFIKSKSDSILNVWPAYVSNGTNKVCFVVQTKEKQLELSDVKYNMYFKARNQYSGENKVAMQSDEAKDNMLKFKDVKHIQEAINEHAPKLLKYHSQLSVISGSGFRSKGYDEHDNSNHKIIPGKTIVMYVKIKGKVPLREKLLPTELNGIPVDVREGGFEGLRLNATDSLPNLRMGCQIASIVGAGTLGGFIHHPKYGLCGTTCAHVVLSDAELKSLVENHNGKKTWEEDEKIIYQPAGGGRVGRVTETFWKGGEGERSGTDLAIFQIEERPPNSGKFPSIKGDEIDNIMIYESGRMCEKSSFLHERKVRKFGSASNLTEGVVRFPGAVCRSDHVTIDQTQYFMNMIDICSLNGGNFCLSGDSGALVFQTGVGRDLVCIGMLIGAVAGNGIALPISEVKEKIGVSEFEQFRWSSIKGSFELLNSLHQNSCAIV